MTPASIYQINITLNLQSDHRGPERVFSTSEQPYNEEIGPFVWPGGGAFISVAGRAQTFGPIGKGQKGSEVVLQKGALS